MFIGLSAETWGEIGAAATAVGSIVAAGALVCGVIGLRQNTRALKWQILEAVFHDIRELDRQHIAEFEGMTGPQKTAWSHTFFNTVEYLCFTVNHRLAPADDLQSFFFVEALPAWRKMFDEHVTNGIIVDAGDLFTEFKRASTEASNAKSLVRPQRMSVKPPTSFHGARSL